MKHLLDNPIFNSLITGNAKMARGGENCKFFDSDIAAFAGLKNNSFSDFEELHLLSDPESLFVVFSHTKLQIPNIWNHVATKYLFQLIYGSQNTIPPQGSGIVDLDESNVKEMMALVELTEPGPFLKLSIEFGNYTGIFCDGKLVAMAGHRFNPKPYSEISAVCTHPNYVKRGFSTLLLQEQIRRILKAGEIPFLHVKSENASAIKLYEKLGFKIRVELIAHVIQKF